jgi:redox-sensitive bicupin YhaK (pirin superfamily)
LEAEVTVIAGQLAGVRPPPPPPHSWAARAESELAIWSIRLAAGAQWRLPEVARAEVVRSLYFFRGVSLKVSGEAVAPRHAAVVANDRELLLEAGPSECEMLMLQGRPIGEPVVQHGPFVMNSRAEIQTAMLDYQRTRFGGWPFPSDAPVHGAGEPRFAQHADGRTERR